MLVSALHEMFGVQLYKNNARALLSRILGILNLDWLQHARSVRGVYESQIKKRNLVLNNNDTYQRETLSERSIRQPLNNIWFI